MTTNNATWQLAGVQLEVGDYATDFEHRSYGQELYLCQRYYFRFLEGNTKEIGAAWYFTNSHASFFFEFPTTMRAVPTGTATSGTDYYHIYRAGGGDGLNSITFENGSTEQFSAFNPNQCNLGHKLFYNHIRQQTKNVPLTSENTVETQVKK